MVFRSRNAPMRRRDAATIRARERLIGGQNHSRTCDRGARATTCQTRALEVPKHEANRFFCPVADITANRQAPSFLLGGVPCRMNVIKQTVTATWRRSTVASQEAPQPKCETAISGWQSIIASWLRPRSGAHFLLVRPSGWRVAPRRVPLGRRSPGLRRHLRDLRAPQHGAPEMVRALTRRTPITCMLIWHCTEQVIVICQ